MHIYAHRRTYNLSIPLRTLARPWGARNCPSSLGHGASSPGLPSLGDFTRARPLLGRVWPNRNHLCYWLCVGVAQSWCKFHNYVEWDVFSVHTCIRKSWNIPGVSDVFYSFTSACSSWGLPSLVLKYALPDEAGKHVNLIIYICMFY